jgi:uncharacterized metal-binding protein
MDCTSGKGSRTGDEHASRFSVTIDATKGKCPAGERRGEENMARGAVPVLSCEGACIRGEIARTVANIVARREGYARGCHGELVTVPGSAIARWIRGAERVIVIDGCFLKCHRRLFAHMLENERIVGFDALSFYGLYTEHFDVDAVSPEERNAVAADVASRIIEELRTGSHIPNTSRSCGTHE